MSYNVHVTRKEFHATSSKSKKELIPKKEFIAFVEKHKKMEIITDSQSDSYVEAIFHPTGERDIYDNLSIEWRDGVVSSNMQIVPKEVLVLLSNFAKESGGVLQGDDGETITDKDISSVATMQELTEHERVQQAQRIDQQKKLQSAKTLRKVRTISLIAVIFLLLIAIIYTASQPTAQERKAAETEKQQQEFKDELNNIVERQRQLRDDNN